MKSSQTSKLKLVAIVSTAMLLTSCVAGPNPLEGTPGANGKVAGFWNGLWDGSIAPFTFVISLFNENVEVYNPNSSGWYVWGFMTGIGGLSTGGASASRRN